jgi:hypothetical protein
MELFGNRHKPARQLYCRSALDGIRQGAAASVVEGVLQLMDTRRLRVHLAKSDLKLS